MSKPPKPSFYHLSTIGSILTLTNTVITNPILSSITTHPTQHPHFHYGYFTQL